MWSAEDDEVAVTTGGLIMGMLTLTSDAIEDVEALPTLSVGVTDTTDLAKFHIPKMLYIDCTVR